MIYLRSFIYKHKKFIYNLVGDKMKKKKEKEIIKEKSKKTINEFKNFAIKGNIMDMAIGVIIGGAFGKIVSSFVADVIMPLISLITGKIDFTNLFIALDGNNYDTLELAKTAGVATLNYGMFLMTVIDFLLIAISIFIAIKQIQKLNKKEEIKEEKKEPTTKSCKYCLSEINIKASKCPFCTSDVK